MNKQYERSRTAGAWSAREFFYRVCAEEAEKTRNAKGEIVLVLGKSSREFMAQAFICHTAAEALRVK